MVTIKRYLHVLGATLAVSHLNHIGIKAQVSPDAKEGEGDVQVDNVDIVKALLELDKWHAEIKEKMTFNG